MWNNEVKVLDVLTTAFTMEVHIMDNETNMDWWFIGIYASTDDQIRRNQWKVIERRKVLQGQRWLISGDFNDITSNEEKWGVEEERNALLRTLDTSLIKMDSQIWDLKATPGHGVIIGLTKGKSSKDQIEFWGVVTGANSLIELV